MNHDWPDNDWTSVNRRINEVDFDTVQEGQALLAQPRRGDKGQIMALQLIATVLNFQYQSSDTQRRAR
ncbi:hypothetical protein [Halapricum desulfuricans]|uniref:Uncharacterized protein n=1 Tax=Halapricum desulfuricans TaxID=2841257 RepID=A0A897NHA6_9EURY|nr:hypothetical protein [Halapricum desulfuricans]QSG13840.1 hypothetical protein HSEST_0290 [Halapricum desulfuricans]